METPLPQKPRAHRGHGLQCELGGAHACSSSGIAHREAEGGAGGEGEGWAGWKCTGDPQGRRIRPHPHSTPTLSPTVFAYGATGAGKTHTMLGREGDPGIMYLTTMELYRRLEAHQEEKRFEVLISYQEVGLFPHRPLLPHPSFLQPLKMGGGEGEWGDKAVGSGQMGAH